MSPAQLNPKHRLFVDQPLSAGIELTLPPESTHYLTRVLRLEQGAHVTLFNGDGFNYLVRIVATRGKQPLLEVETKVDGPPSITPQLVLALALLKGDRMDYALQKATELDVQRVQLFPAARSEVKLSGARLEKKQRHWQRVVASASEQCGRTRLPAISVHKSFREMMTTTRSMNCYAFEPSAPHGKMTAGEKPICSVIGPEGGFEQAELAELAKHCTMIGFGNLVLRAETAPVVALTLANQARREFNTPQG